MSNSNLKFAKMLPNHDILFAFENNAAMVSQF